ncbi:MAG: FAD/NAD(P)-binding protein [Bacillota bacterium]
MDNPYQVVSGLIYDIIQESPMIRTLRLIPEKPVVFRTGQFIELTVPGVGEGPFTPSSSHYISDKLDVTVMKAGFVTEYIHMLKAGDTIGIRGPYGTCYPLDKFCGRDILILGGGCGLAPLRSLFLTLLHDLEKYNSITFLAGAKTPNDCIYKDFVSEWRGYNKVQFIRAVDQVPIGEKWDEDVCLVTKLLQRINISPVDNPAILCGPPVMMKFGTIDLLNYGYSENNIFLSMEKKMYCGFGQCRHCLIGPYYACKDGPVFTYSQIKSEEAIWD